MVARPQLLVQRISGPLPFGRIWVIALAPMCSATGATQHAGAAREPVQLRGAHQHGHQRDAGGFPSRGLPGWLCGILKEGARQVRGLLIVHRQHNVLGPVLSLQLAQVLYV